MKRRPFVSIIIIIISCCILAGCGKAEDTSLADKLQTAKESEEKTKDSKDDKKNKSKSKKKKSGETADSDLARAFEENKVDNNGSYFVRIGNKVYFRNIRPEAMAEGATFGEFLHTEYSPTECPLICYDMDTREWEEIGSIKGAGKLYACPEGFYIGEPDQNDPHNSCTDLYAPETGKSAFYCEGTPLGVSAGGRILAVERQAGQTIHTVLIKNGEEIADLGGENIYYEYCGFSGETLIALLHTADDEFILCSVDESGDVTQLGQVGAGQPGYPELEEFIVSGGTLYLTFGYYEGTGHFLSDYETVTAVPGTEGSLKKADVYDDEKAEYPENTVPKLCFEPEGVAFYSEHRPYEAYMGAGDNSNNMYYFDEVYDECILLKDFLRDDNGQKCQIVQDIASFPETVFAIYADAQEDDEYSIGWRTGYKMTGWHICAIPFGYGQYDGDKAAEGMVFFGEEKTGDPLEGLVADDILAMFRESNPVKESATVEDEALRLGSWVQENIGKVPGDVREKGEEIGRHYEFWFGTDIANNYDDNFRRIYGAYYSLKDYYTSDGKRNRDYYEGVSEENDFLGNGDPKNIENMYSDMKDFITDCNTIIRNKQTGN